VSAPDIEKALAHLSAAAVEADIGLDASEWKAGENPDPAWWSFRDAGNHIRQAEADLQDARRRVLAQGVLEEPPA